MNNFDWSMLLFIEMCHYKMKAEQFVQLVKIMDEFVKMKGKVLKIENPIAMFATILTTNGERVLE